jgi:hypothetical protein
VLAALAQACGGSSSQSSGPKGNRVELRFKEAKGIRLGALPSGCSSVEVTFQPGGTTVSAGDTTLSVLLVAGTYQVHGVLHCNGTDFQSDPPDPVFTVPPGLQSVEVALVFGSVNVDLTVQVSGGIQVTGSGIGCPGDCTQSYLAGTKIKLTANNPDAVFTGGCNGQGSCEVLMNQDKTVFVSLPAQDGFIQVGLIGCCDADILIDGVLVANDLTSDDPPVKKKVSSGNHQVRALCFGEGDASGSPANVQVDPGETEVRNFSCD